jgi:hypothetical protein
VKCVDGTAFRVKFKKNKPKQIKTLRLAKQNSRRKPLEAEGIIPIVLGYYTSMLVRLLYYFGNKDIFVLFDVMFFVDSFLSRSNN